MRGLFLIPLLLTASASAEAAFNHSYYCADEVAGGIRFNEDTKRWEAAHFKPSDKFVLKLRAEGNTAKEKVLGVETEVSQYRVTITRGGTSIETSCTSLWGDSQTIKLAEGRPIFSCRANFSEFRFNLITHRYLSAYLIGYVHGEDNNNDTPSISGGKCTKID